MLLFKKTRKPRKSHMGAKVLSPVFTYSIHQKEEIAEGTFITFSSLFVYKKHVCMCMQNYVCGFWWLIMVASMIKANLSALCQCPQVSI